MKNLFKSAKFIFLVATVVLSAVIIAVYFFLIAPKNVGGDKEITLEINYLENSYAYTITTDKETVLEMLIEYNDVYDLQLQTQGGAYGEFITSLKGVSQDEKNGYYYVYTLNHGYASGISTQTIKDGDVIIFDYCHQVYDENFNLISSSLKGKGQTANYVITGVIMLLTACIYFLQVYAGL
jgi:hypothetical protein